MRNCCVIILKAALALLVIGLAAPSGEPTPDFLRWTASWITCPDAPVRDAAVFHFRKLLTLENAPAHFIVHVSADNQFLLYINQHRVATGPASGHLAHWRFDTYDLAPFLRSVSIVLPATVCNL